MNWHKYKCRKKHISGQKYRRRKNISKGRNSDVKAMRRQIDKRRNVADCLLLMLVGAW